MKTKSSLFGALFLIATGAWLVKRYSKHPAKQRITSDEEGHYDIDGVSLSAFKVIVASDADAK